MAKFHVIPVGFDIERLYLPITRGELEADTVVLLKSLGDTELVEQNIDRLRRELNSHDVEVLVKTIEKYDYRKLYGDLYRLLEEELEAGSELYLNITSMPRTVTFALATAGYNLQLERPNRRDQIHIYYAAAEEYYAPRLIEEIDEDAAVLNQVRRLLNSRRDRRKGSISDRREQLEDILQHLGRVAEATEVGSAENEQRQLQDISTSSVSERSRLPDRYRELQEFIEYTNRLFDSDFQQAVEDQLHQIRDDPEFENISSKTVYHRFEALDFVLPDESGTGVESVLDDAESVYNSLNRELNVRENLEFEIEDRLDVIKNILRDVDRYDLTSGAREIQPGQHHIEFPAPINPPERTTERAILFVLSRSPEFESNTALAAELAEVFAERFRFEPEEIIWAFFEHGISRRAINRQLTEVELEDEEASEVKEVISHLAQTPYSDLQPPMRELLESIVEGAHHVIDRDKMREKFESRVQYNISSLNNKGFVKRKRRGRRTSTVLSEAGELWLDTHDLESELPRIIGSMISKQLSRIVVEETVEAVRSDLSPA